MEEKSALVFGSTGLVGNYLVEELIKDSNYSSIKVFVRKSTGRTHPRVIEYVVDFDKPDDNKELFKGNDLFICLGTTLKQAGSVEKMEKIDRELPVSIARIALSNGVKNMAIVSSVGANSRSKNYYLRIKGKMEEEMLNIGFQNICIVRPSLLLGDRKEKRLSEIISKNAMKCVGFLFIGKIRKFRPIHGKTVARAMIKILNENLGKLILESNEVQLAGE